MVSAPNSFQEIASSIAESMGYELVGVELASHADHGGTLRVYIDHENGISLQDCATVSRQLSAALDVEGTFSETYSLEVSSPGLDRLLFGKRDFTRFAGHRVDIKLRDKIEGRRRYKGLLQGVEEDLVLVDVEGERWELPLELIERARLVPEF